MRYIKYYFIAVFMLLVTDVLFAQAPSLSGTVIDNKGAAIEGVYVTYSFGGKTLGCKTDATGHFKLESIMGDSISLRFSHINYKDTVKTVKKNSYGKPLKMMMRAKSQSLKSVTVSAESPNGNLKGDTTVYYATAYKTNRDATAYDLIQKLPGVGVNDGEVQAHGETVSEILIDGKEYSDITMALKNLPAYVVNEVQIYYKGSDYSRITGFDDGNREMVLNFSTQQPSVEKLMGKVQLGYGTEGFYDCYGNLNWFKERHKLSLFAQLNNVNRQDFSGLSLAGRSSENTPGQSPYSKGRSNGSSSMEGGEEKNESNDGLTSTTAAALNHSFQTEDSTFSITTHYLYSNVDNTTEYDMTDYFFVDTLTQHQHQALQTLTNSHRFRTKMEWRLSSRDIIVFNPDVSYQRRNEMDAIRLSQGEGQTQLTQNACNDEKNLMAKGQFTYVHRIGRKGAALSLDINGGHLKNDKNDNVDIVQTSDNVRREISNESGNSQIDGVLSIVSPSIKRYSRLKFDIGMSNRRANNDVMAQMSNSTWGMAMDTMSSGMLVLDDKAAVGRVIYTFSRRKTNLVSGLEYKRTEHDVRTMRMHIDTGYSAVLPFLQLRYQVNAKNQLHLNYVTKQLQPSVSMCQEAANVVNPMLLVVGNASLNPALSHDVSLRWLSNDVARSRFLVLFAKYGMVTDYIASVRNIEVDAAGGDVQVVSYRNSEEPQQSVEVLGAYGFPVKAIKSNVNLSSFWRLSHVPGYYDDAPSSSRAMCWNNSVTVGSNISERVDFVVDFNATYNSDINSQHSQYSSSYWSFSAGGQLVTRIGKHLKTTVECGYTGYQGDWVSKYNALISNVSLSALLGRNECFELQLAVNDIFNQNNNFYQSTTELYLRETEASVLKRYVMLKMIYKFNNSRNEN